MRIKDILLVARAGEPCQALMAIAARLAREHGALVDGVCVYSEPQVPAAQVEPVKAAFEAAIAQPGLASGWSVGEAEATAWAFIRQARLADLIVAGIPGHDSLAQRLVESLVFNSGAPCLLVPCAFKDHGFGRVLLAWDGSREAKMAMDDSVVLMGAAKSVRVVMAHEDHDHGPYEAHGGQLLAHLARHGLDAELQVVAKPGERIGDVLLEECQAFGADLLVMGAYGHPRAQEMMLGGATRTMLAQAGQPVLMSH
jgi:nucleotide-binding universal stress UspA family protein